MKKLDYSPRIYCYQNKFYYIPYRGYGEVSYNEPIKQIKNIEKEYTHSDAVWWPAPFIHHPKMIKSSWSRHGNVNWGFHVRDEVWKVKTSIWYKVKNWWTNKWEKWTVP